MGINRLWSHIKNNQDSVVLCVDLVETAKGYNGGLKILVDFYSWEHFMVSRFRKSVTELTQNRNIIFAGGEYSMMDTFIKNFVRQLEAVNIKLVFFLDGAKGSSDVSSRQKMRTWQSRYKQDQEGLRKTANFLRGLLPIEAADVDHMTRPCLQEVQNVLTLQECGCAIHLQVSGEADSMIAKYMQNDPAAFAVLSNDTDFCIFPNSVFLSVDYFDIHNELGLGLRTLKVKQPKKLICGIIRTESIMRLLGLPDHESLIELAIISGNDFTSPFLNNIPAFYKNYRGQLDKLAKLICLNRVAEMCPFIRDEIMTDSNLREAVQHSRKFYSLKLEDEEEKEDNLTYSLIAEDIKKGRLPSTVMAMYRGLYWHRQVLEDPAPGLPVADLAFTDLRAYIYSMILPPHKMSVTEIGRTPSEPVKEIVVSKVVDPNIPDLVQVKQSSFSQKLHVFEVIMQHQESQVFNEERSYFKMYGLRKGFICCLLRYFLLMNWGKNLFLSAQEFFVVIAWMLGNRDTRYQQMSIVPSPRCITVENWFLTLYRNAYAFLGNILSLSNEFPAPRDLFSGATWVALYTSCAVLDSNPLTREPQPRSVTMDEIHRINFHMKQIVSSNRQVVKDIIKGLFYFE